MTNDLYFVKLLPYLCFVNNLKKTKMKNLKFLSVALLSILMFFASCDVKNSENGKKIISKASQNIVDQIDALVNSNFSDAAKGFIYVDQPFDISGDNDNKKSKVQNISKVKNIGIALKNSITKKFPKIFNKKFGDTTFSLTPYFGTYTWQDTMWVFKNSPTDKVILIFPSPSSITNDLRLEWSKYEEVKTNDNTYLPTVIYAEFFKDNHKIGKIDYSATWNLKYDYPTVLSAKVFLDPLKFKIDYSFADNKATLNASAVKGLRTLDDVNTEITFKNDSMNDVTYVKGIFKTYDLNSSVNTGVLLKIKFDVNVAKIPDEATADQVNSNSTIELYASSGRLVATVIATDNDDDDCDVLLKYNDGTTESLCDYTDNISDAVDRILHNAGYDK